MTPFTKSMHFNPIQSKLEIIEIIVTRYHLIHYFQTKKIIFKTKKNHINEYRWIIIIIYFIKNIKNYYYFFKINNVNIKLCD